MQYNKTSTSLLWVRNMYKEMIEYYQENMGSKSKYSEGRVKITPNILKILVKRHNQLAPISQIILNGVAKNGR